MSRWTVQQYLKEREAQQKHWVKIRHLAPNSDPDSPESTLFFYESCIEHGVKLDEAQYEELEDLRRTLKPPAKRITFVREPKKETA